MNSETMEYLKSLVTEIRDDADVCEDDDEGKQAASELRFVAASIDAAIGVSDGIRQLTPEAARFYQKTLDAHINNLFDQFDDMSRKDKIDDRGGTMEMAYHIREAMRVMECALYTMKGDNTR